MPNFTVWKIYKSVERVEVEADDELEAKSIAMQVDGDEVDYFLYDTVVREAG